MTRVLLIDDDDFIAVSLRQYLAARGIDAISATDRVTAERYLSVETFDLVLIDPYMTGESNRDLEETLGLIRTLQPSTRMVVLTAYTSPQLTAAGTANEATAVLTKPQSVVFLSQLVVTALRMQRNHSPETLSA